MSRRIDFNALGGADTITVNDLSGTDVTQVNIDLAGMPGGGGDGAGGHGHHQRDRRRRRDHRSPTTTAWSRCRAWPATVDDHRLRGATDRIVINGLGGDDVIEASGLGAAMQLTANGGDGDDVLIGSAGNDTLTGGAGDDVLIGGRGPGRARRRHRRQRRHPRRVGRACRASAPSAPASRSQFAGTAGNDADQAVARSNGGVTVIGTWRAAVSSTLPRLPMPDCHQRARRRRRHRRVQMTAPSMQFILDGGAGNDVLHGGQGNDLLHRRRRVGPVRSSPGSTAPTRSPTSSTGSTRSSITGYGAALDSFSDLAGHIAQVGADVQIDLGAKVAGAGTIVLQNTQLAAIGASDFTFA